MLKNKTAGKRWIIAAIILLVILVLSVFVSELIDLKARRMADKIIAKREAELQKEYNHYKALKIQADSTLEQLEYQSTGQQNRKQFVKENFETYIRSSQSHYDVHFIGGISGLTITVSNKSEFMINYVEVVVRYFLKKGVLYKKEKVVFNNLAPSTSRTQIAPKSDRGKLVNHYINVIRSDELGFFYKSDTN